MIRRLALLAVFLSSLSVVAPGVLPLTSTAMAAGACTGSTGSSSGTFCAAAGTLSQTTELSTSNAWANQWPSTDTVSGLGGTLSSISVTLYDWSASFDTTNLEYLLVAPNGTAYEFLQTYDCNDFGDGVKDTASTITFSDSGNAFPTSGDCSSLGGNTYKPTVVASGDVFPKTVNNVGTPGATAGSSDFSYSGPAPDSAPHTLAGTFGNISPNGAWGLYLENGFPADCDQGGCESSSLGSATDSPWSLNITTTGASTTRRRHRWRPATIPPLQRTPAVASP